VARDRALTAPAQVHGGAHRGALVRRGALPLTVLLGQLLGGTGCAGTLDDPDRFADGGALTGAASDDAASATDTGLRDTDAAASIDAAACANVPQSVFLPSCTSAGCHNSQDKEQGLDLQSPNAASRLINIPSSEGAGLLIDPTTPTNSVLYTKLMPNPPFGAQMPPKEPLDDATIACVLAWIVAQATDAGADATGEGGASADAGIVPEGGPLLDSGP
jgi:hypothetical protein